MHMRHIVPLDEGRLLRAVQRWVSWRYPGHVARLEQISRDSESPQCLQVRAALSTGAVVSLSVWIRMADGEPLAVCVERDST